MLERCNLILIYVSHLHSDLYFKVVNVLYFSK